MKDAKTKEKFIELRAEGLSFDKIAEQLHVGKQTLINWSKELKAEISNLQSIRLEALREQYALSQEAKIKRWGEICNKITQELLNRTWDDVDTPTLMAMLIKAMEKLESVDAEPHFRSEEEIEDEKWEREQFLSLNPFRALLPRKQRTDSADNADNAEEP